MTGGPGEVRLALSDGLRAAGLWFGALSLAASWAAAALLPGAEVMGVVLHASGGLIAAGGGVLLAAEAPPKAAAPRLGIGAVLLLAGFTIALAGAAPALEPATTAAFPVAAFEVAMIAFAANAGRRQAPLITSAILVGGAEAVCATLGRALGLRFAPDVAGLTFLALVVAVSLGLRPTATRVREARRAGEEAAEQETLTRTLAVARSRTAAVVHDTVLNDLAALAAIRPGPLPRGAAGGLARTAGLLASPDWGVDVTTGPLPGGAFLAALGRAERAGLRVRVDGDLGLIATLPRGSDRALAQATEQCLSNTLRHSGTDRAEVTVLGDAAAVTVMVADTGAGFEPEAVGADRLGLSTAVTGRVEAVGGTVRVFTRPGVGTTVLLSVPKGGRE